MREIRPLQRQEEAHVSCLLADALFTNSAYKYIISGDDQSRQERLVWFFRFRLAVVREMGGVTLGLFECGKCVSTLTLGPIETQDPSPMVLIKCGALNWPLILGLPSISRAKKFGKLMKDASNVANGKNNWEVMMVATAPQLQGRGLSSALFLAALDLLRNEAAGSKIILGLTTQKASNVSFYSKLGFVVTGELDAFEGSPEAVHSWIMRLEL